MRVLLDVLAVEEAGYADRIKQIRKTAISSEMQERVRNLS